LRRLTSRSIVPKSASKRIPVPAPKIRGENSPFCPLVEVIFVVGLFWLITAVDPNVGVELEPGLIVAPGTGVLVVPFVAVAVSVLLVWVGVAVEASGVAVGKATGILVGTGLGVGFGGGEGVGVGVADCDLIVTGADELSVAGCPLPALAVIVPEPRMLLGTVKVSEKEPLASESAEPSTLLLLPDCSTTGTNVPAGR
jgi:hypothetical protein